MLATGSRTYTYIQLGTGKPAANLLLNIYCAFVIYNVVNRSNDIYRDQGIYP